MSLFPLPSPEAVDADWMTAALGESGMAGTATVESLELVGDIGTGQAARSVRFNLVWDDPEVRPDSVVGKFPSSDPGARVTLESTGGYWKEWLFYDQIAQTVDMRVPACYSAKFDPDTSDFVLVMEDIRNSSPGDQLDGLSEDQLALAVEQAAMLHGPRMGDEGLEALLGSGPGASTLAEAGPFCQEMYEAVLPDFVERFADSVEAEAMDLIHRSAPHVARWFRGTGSPITLVHQDLRADNLLYSAVGRTSIGAASNAGATSNDDPAVVVVDFQALTAGVGATDLAYLIGGSVADADERAAIERGLLDVYRSRLGGYGVKPSADELWNDYRHGSLWGVIMTVLSSIGSARTDRGEVMFAAMANRHARHALELEALDVLS